MCGIIFGANSGKSIGPVNQFIIDQFQDQVSRGKEGFGIVMMNEDKTYKMFKATEPTKFMLDLYMNQSQVIMAHHRYPTSTPNKIAQAHPMFISDGSLKHDYLIVHNGVISNAEELKKEHMDNLGFIYKTQIKVYEREKFNDSEAFAIELARYIEGQSKKIEALGSIAFVAMKIDKETTKIERIYFGRKNNPLNMAKTRGIIRLSSEGPGEEVAPNLLYSFEPTGKMNLQRTGLVFKEEAKIIITPQKDTSPRFLQGNIAKTVEIKKEKSKVYQNHKSYSGIYSGYDRYDEYDDYDRYTGKEKDIEEDSLTEELESLIEDAQEQIIEETSTILSKLFREADLYKIDTKETVKIIGDVLDEAIRQAQVIFQEERLEKTKEKAKSKQYAFTY